MTQSLSINNKKYIQSNVLATRVGYTSDYIGKLAREEKVLGTQIGRQWFVEPESLATYLEQTRIEKEIRKEELSLKRKAEHLTHLKKQTEPKTLSSHGAIALAQALIIVACGGFIGGLGFIVSSEDIGTSELASGAQASIALIDRSIFSFDFSGESVEPDQQVAAFVQSTRAEESAADARDVFAILPVFPERTETEEVSTSEEPQIEGTLLDRFSDEVKVVIDQEGNQLIEPVFKEEPEEAVQFLLVPVKAQES